MEPFGSGLDDAGEHQKPGDDKGDAGDADQLRLPASPRVRAKEFAKVNQCNGDRLTVRRVLVTPAQAGGRPHMDTGFRRYDGARELNLIIRTCGSGP